MLRYPARLEPTEHGKVRLILPDVPEVEVIADSEVGAVDAAAEALEGALGGYILDARPIPTPSDVCGAPMIETPRQPAGPRNRRRLLALHALPESDAPSILRLD